jgi:hypothetical protein
MTRGLGWRTLAIIAIPVLLVPAACQGVFLMTHPAPLGRSARKILEHLDTALPPGSTVDSAARFFGARGIAYEVDSAHRVADLYRDDSDFVGGPVLTASAPAVARMVFVYNGEITLFFDPRGRLVHRRASLSADNPL